MILPNVKPFCSESAQLLDNYHKTKVSRRKLNLAEIFNTASWHQSVKRTALMLYDVCHTSKQWSREFSQGWLARQLRLARPTVNIALKQLERLGLVKVFRRGHGLTHTYQFTIPPWLERFLNKIPNYKGYLKKQVLDELTQSNVDLTKYKEYTQYRESKDERIRVFRQRNPEKAPYMDKKYTASETWSASHAPYVHKEVMAAPKALALKGMAALRSLFGLA